jgi:hypothetical protein
MINRFVSQRPSVSKLSKLQRRILEEGLKAHWHKPIHLAWGIDTPGCFGVSKILEEFFGASKEEINRPFGRRWARAQNRLARLAAPRAAVSRARMPRPFLQPSCASLLRFERVQVARESDASTA